MKEREMEKLLKAVASRRRLAILSLLKERGGQPVGTIARNIDLSIKSTSKHLRILSAVDLVDNHSVGVLMYYELSSAHWEPIRQLIKLL